MKVIKWIGYISISIILIFGLTVASYIFAIGSAQLLDLLSKDQNTNVRSAVHKNHYYQSSEIIYLNTTQKCTAKALLQPNGTGECK